MTLKEIGTIVLKTGLKLLENSQFGSWGLPTDWIIYSKSNSIHSKEPHRFGYDAVRIPLYLKWGGLNSSVLDKIKAYWERKEFQKKPFAWLNVEKGNSSAELVSLGMRRIIELVDTSVTFKETSQKTISVIIIPPH